MPLIVPKRREELLERAITSFLANTDIVDLSDSSIVKQALSTVMQEIETLYYSLYLVEKGLDLYEASGTELDRRVALVAPDMESRTGATIASGTFLFIRQSTTGQKIIPQASVVSTASGVEFETTSTLVMNNGVGTASVPIVARVAGTSGNQSIGAINTLSAALTDLSGYNNTTTAGGLDEESDDQLRSRALNYSDTLTRVTPTAIEQTLLNVQDPVSGNVVRSARVLQHSKGHAVVYIDDGTSGAELGTPVVGASILTAQGEEEFVSLPDAPITDVTITSSLRGVLSTEQARVDNTRGEIRFVPTLVAGEEITADYTFYINTLDYIQNAIYTGALECAPAGNIIEARIVSNRPVSISIVVSPTPTPATITTIKNLVVDYVNGLREGRDVIAAEIIGLIIDLEAVDDVSVVGGNIAILANEVASATVGSISVQ